MKYARGDKVAIKGKQKEGRVVRYLQGDTVEVALEDNTIIEISESELEFPYLNWFRKESQKKTKDSIKKYKQREADFAQERTPNGILLGFYPEYFSDEFDDLIENVKIYFYNDSPDEIDFLYSYTDKDTELIEVKKKVAAYENFYLHGIALSQLSEHPKFKLKLSPTGEPLTDIALKINPNKLYKNLIELNQESLPAYFIKLGDSIYSIYVPQTIDLRKLDQIKVKKTISEAPISTPDSTVLDLHLDALYPEDHTSIAKPEALGHQIQAFRDFMSRSIKEKQSKITVIHGIGKGKLREQIHALLESNPFVKKYQNELHPSYGYGATEIWLK